MIIFDGAAFPFSFSRQNGQPLDVTSVMRTLADITTYAANAEKKYVPYEGQAIACLEDKMLYILELKNGVLVPKQSGGVKLIKRDDNVELTDDAALSALRSVKEIEDRAISRTKRDTAAEVIEFAKGLTAGSGKTTVSGDGKITTLNLLVQALASTYDLNVSHVATMMRTIIKDYVSSEAFTPGLMGEGFKISKALNGDWNLEVDNIVVRKVMTIFEMVISKVRSVNGGLVISPANGRIKSVAETTGSPAYYVIGIEGDMQFVVDDYVRCQVFSNGHAKHYWVRVSSISGNSILVLKSEFTNGVVPAVGDDLVQMGNATNTARQGVIYLTASEDGKPRISVLDGVNSTSTVGKNKVILGCLDGITDADFPADFQPSGYGLYAMNVFLKGIFVLRSGKSVESELTATNAAVTAAKQIADAAQGKANDAATAAATAQAKANEANTAAGTAQSTANGAVANAATANSLLSDIANDNKFTATEKQSTKKEWDVIVSEKPLNNASAVKFSVSTAAYDSAYNALNAYITPLLSNLSATSDIVGTTFRSTFKAYYDARTNLLNAVSEKAKKLADDAQSAANAAQTKADTVTTSLQTFLAGGGLFESKITETKTYADNKASDAKSQAITAAASDATTKANSAVTTALGNTITEIEKIEIGGRNFYMESATIKTYAKGSDYGNSSRWSNIVEDGIEFTRIAPTAYGNFYFYPKLNGYPFNTKAGESYTVSFKYRTTQISSIGLYNYLFIGGVSAQIPPSLGWQTFSRTYIISVDKTIYSPELLGFEQLIAGMQVDIRDIKLERGNKATDWTAAHEDVTADAQAKADEAKQAAIDDAANKYPTKTEVSTSITQLSNSISLKADKTEVTGLGTRVSAAEAKITPDAIRLTVKSQTETIATDAATKAVAGVVVGGRNLAIGTGVHFIGTGYGRVCWLPLSEPLVIGEHYILSYKSNDTVASLSWSVTDSVNSWVDRQTFLNEISFPARYNSRALIIWAENPTVKFDIYDVKFERGNKATDWTAAPEDAAADTEAARLAAVAAQTAANNAASTANAAKSRLDDWSADGSISPTEKLTLTQEQKALLDEKTQIVADAAKYAVSSTAYVTAYTNYNGELTYHTTVTPEVIAIRANFATYQTAYYTAKQTILNAISAAAKKYAEDQADKAKNLAINYADTYFSTKSDFTILSNQISSKVSQTDFNALGQRVSTAETSITQQAGQIDLKASKSDLGALTGRVTSAEAELRVHATEIGMKVTAGDVSAGMTITANKITLFGKEFDLTGKITFSSMAPDAQGKITTAQGTADRAITDAANSLVTSRNNIASQLGYGSYDAMSAAAIAGKTIINGGMIRTELLDARAIVTGALVSEVISATNITTGKLTVTDGAVIGGFTVKNEFNSYSLINDDLTAKIVIRSHEDKSIRIGGRESSMVRINIDWSADGYGNNGIYIRSIGDNNTSIELNTLGNSYAIKSSGSHSFFQRQGDVWNAPGVLWCGRYQSLDAYGTPTLYQSWGDGLYRTPSISRYGYGKFRISHSLGHNQYFIQAIAYNQRADGGQYWPSIVNYAGISDTHFNIEFKNDGGGEQCPGEFIVCIFGRNKFI